MEILELAEQFFERYAGLPRAYGVYRPGHKNEDTKKVGGNARTEMGSYTMDLWRMHLLGEQGLGVVPITDDSTCSWGAIDVDVYPLDLEELDLKVRKLKLPLVVIRTKSGGAHLTCFLTEPGQAAMMRSRLTEFAMALGWGGLEIFPKQVRLAGLTDVGNWLNMPYFEGDNSTRYAIRNGRVLNMEEFLEYADDIAISPDQLAAIKLELSDHFDDGPPCLQVLATNGIPEGSRNNALFAMGVYARLKHEDDWEHVLDSLNMELMDPPLPSREVQMVTRSLNRKQYFYPCTKAPICHVCNKNLCKKREFGIGDQGGTEFDITIGSLVKILTDPPTWIIDIEGIRVELETDDLMNQERFRRLCVSAINKLPSKLKPISWERLIRERLENVEEQEAPKESSVKGRLHFYFEQFLSVTPHGKERDELLMGKPYVEEGITYFRGNDLIRYLETQGMRIDSRTVYMALRQMKVGHGQFNIKGKNVQVWKIDYTNYQTESFSTPEQPPPDF